MGVESYSQGPRVSIADTDTGEAIEFPIFPEGLEHTSEANWARHSVPGLSHQVQQFINTNSAKFSFEVVVDTLDGVTAQAEVERIYRFLDSMQFPGLKEFGDGLASAGASRYLLAWPGVANLVIISASVSFNQTRFAQLTGKLLAFTAKISIEESRDLRISKEEVRRRGLFRAGGSGPAR